MNPKPKLFGPAAARVAVGLSLLALLAAVPAGAEMLDLPAAEALALERDADGQARRAEAEARREAAVASGQWPDPRLSLGVANLPTDSWALDQEAMTQMTLGLSQNLPRGHSARLQRQRGEAEARGLAADAETREAEVRRAVRTLWVELHARLAEEALLQRSATRLRQLARFAADRFREGEGLEQAVLEAELAADRLADGLIEARGRVRVARADLDRWLGDQVSADLNLVDWPLLPKPPTALRPEEHPELRAVAARLEATQQAHALARQDYRPQWAFNLGYGYRAEAEDGGERPDFVSFGISVDLPLFTGQRQDRAVAAARERAGAESARRDDRLRELASRWARTEAAWEALTERDAGYRDTLLPRAEARRAAALDSYRADRGGLADALRAEITLLETRQSHVEIRRQALQAQAALLYLAGETR